MNENQEYQEIDLVELDEVVSAGPSPSAPIPDGLKEELKSILGYMDHLLESLQGKDDLKL